MYFKGTLHGLDVILGPTRIRIFLYCRNLRQKIRLSTKLELLFFTVYGRNLALGYLIPIVDLISFPTHLW